MAPKHTAYSIWCENCACDHQAELRQAVVRAGLFGPRLTSLVAYLQGRMHASYSGIRDVPRELALLRLLGEDYFHGKSVSSLVPDSS